MLEVFLGVFFALLARDLFKESGEIWKRYKARKAEIAAGFFETPS